MPDTIPFSPSILQTHAVIDVRSPAEFSEDHIPGSVNVPLLLDDERAIVGTIYKQEGPGAARLKGLQLSAHRFPAMVAEIVEAAGERPLIVTCWRGGLRSRSVVTLLELCGIRAVQLKGGYQSFRRAVVSFFEESPFAPRLVILHGMTGVGKSELLRRLAERGHAVVDLEGIARHRGSAFGGVGLSQDISQKRFETLLWDAFRLLPPQGPIILEGESKRIGRYFLPGRLPEAMANARTVWCSASMETRVERLMAEYGRPDYREVILSALGRIRKRLGDLRHRRLRDLVESWELSEFTRLLIQWYYDPLYYRSPIQNPDLNVSLESYDDALAVIEPFLAAVD